jgi:hypothetical protein
VATTQRSETHPVPLSAGNWRVVPELSELAFATRALGFMRVRGRSSGVAGELHIDRCELAALEPSWDGAITVSGTLNVRDRPLAIHAPVSVAPAGAGGLRVDADFEVDHHAACFEFTRLPRTVPVKASLTPQPTS